MESPETILKLLKQLDLWDSGSPDMYAIRMIRTLLRDIYERTIQLSDDDPIDGNGDEPAF